MTKFEMYQTSRQHYQELRAQVRILRTMDKQNISAVVETVVDGLAFSVCVAMVCLFGVLV